MGGQSSKRKSVQQETKITKTNNSSTSTRSYCSAASPTGYNYCVTSSPTSYKATSNPLLTGSPTSYRRTSSPTNYNSTTSDRIPRNEKPEKYATGTASAEYFFKEETSYSRPASTSSYTNKYVTWLRENSSMPDQGFSQNVVYSKPSVSHCSRSSTTATESQILSSGTHRHHHSSRTAASGGQVVHSTQDFGQDMVKPVTTSSSGTYRHHHSSRTAASGGQVVHSTQDFGQDMVKPVTTSSSGTYIRHHSSRTAASGGQVVHSTQDFGQDMVLTPVTTSLAGSVEGYSHSLVTQVAPSQPVTHEQQGYSNEGQDVKQMPSKEPEFNDHAYDADDACDNDDDNDYDSDSNDNHSNGPNAYDKDDDSYYVNDKDSVGNGYNNIDDDDSDGESVQVETDVDSFHGDTDDDDKSDDVRDDVEDNDEKCGGSRAKEDESFNCDQLSHVKEEEKVVDLSGATRKTKYVLVSITLPAAMDWDIVYNDLKRITNNTNFKLQNDTKSKSLHKNNFCISFANRKKARYAIHMIKRRRKTIEVVYCDCLIQKCQDDIQNEKERVLALHNKKAEDVTQKLMSLQVGTGKTQKKTKYVSLEEFQRREATKEALMQTAKELNAQSKEFVQLTTELTRRAEQLRGVCDRDITVDLKEIEARFLREKERLTGSLPIYAEKTRIIEAIKENQVCIVLGETGSGKSTQLVQYLYDAGFADNKAIVCTQPRKVAAFSLAKRVSEELKDNRLVDCMDGTRKGKMFSKIFFTTDHSLLMKCLKDRDLSSYSCIVIDEAHERNINTDLLLGIIKKALPSRPDLRVIVTSATIDPTLFQNYFGGCPVIKVSGKLFPVEVEWKKSQYGDDYVSEAVDKVAEIQRSNEEGDVLVFLTCPAEIDRACNMLPNKMNTRDIVCLPLHGKLQQEDQRKVFDPTPPGKRKVVFSTNCAETSLTIPGIKFVIDSGRAKEMKYDQKRNLSSLEIAIVSQSSANQRKGRAGRTDSGKCFRLYTEEQFIGMEKSSKPEILRVHLGQAILKLMELGISNPADFDFVESPPPESIRASMSELEELGAIEEGKLSELGKRMARLPLEPRLGKFLFEGFTEGVGYEALVLVSIATIAGSVFFRMGTEEEKKNADDKKFAFCQFGGDLMTLLEVFRKWLDVDERDRGRWCYKWSLNAKAMRMAYETVKDLKMLLKRELNIVNIQWATFSREETDKILQKTLFSCYLSKLCVFTGHEKVGYQTVVGNHFVKIHPSSAIKFMGEYPTFVVYEKILKTSQDFIINVTPIEEQWLRETITDPVLIVNIQEAVDNVMVKRTVICSEPLIAKTLSPFKEKMPLLESEVSGSCNGVPVVAEVQRKNGILDIFISKQYADDGERVVQRFLAKGRMMLRDETSEYPLEDAPGLKVVIESGVTVQQVLMPGMYRSIFSPHANQDLHEFLKSRGNVIDISVSKQNQTFATYETPKEAQCAVRDARDLEFTVLPKRSGKNQQAPGNFNFMVTMHWLRREPKGMANVAFDVEPVPWNDFPLRWSRKVMIRSKEIRITADKYRPNAVFLQNLHASSTKIEIKRAIEEIFPGTSVSESSISFQYNQRGGNSISTPVQRKVLEKLISQYASPDGFEVSVKAFPPNQDKCPFANALIKFANPNEGMEAAKRLQSQRFEGLERWPVTLDVRPKLDYYYTCLKEVYDAVKAGIQQQITTIAQECQDNCGYVLNFKEQPLGKSPRIKLTVETECLDHYVQASKEISLAIQGEYYDCTKPKERMILLSAGAKDKLATIQRESGARICPDVRKASLVIYGTRSQKEQAIDAIERFLCDLVLSDSTLWEVHLKGNDKPRGLLKHIISECGNNLEKLCEIDGVVSVKKCIFKHVLTIESNSTAREEVLEKIKEIEKSLPCQADMTRSPEAATEECPICFCEVVEAYRVGTCGHAYCRKCAMEQVKAAVFPIVCAECNENFTIRDMHLLLCYENDLLKNIIKQSLDAYLGAHPEEARHCPSPDCPMIYLVTQEEKQFRCNLCSVATCTACHKAYHLGMTCKEYEESRADDSGRKGLEKWMRENSDERKHCPECKRPIERNGGCSHMKCPTCKNHFCWLCLNVFESGHAVYEHQGDCPRRN